MYQYDVKIKKCITFKKTFYPKLNKKLLSS